MSGPVSNCDDRQILAMLQDELDVDQSNAIAEHISNCRQCQRRCEELAASPAEWRLVVDALSEPSDGATLRSASIPFERSWNHCYWNESIAKQLLGPPTHPEMLGRLSRYEIERVIGIGGMGVVFKGYDSELGRPVAIKVLAPFLAGNATAVQRFAREARAAAAVVHQHVVPIHNVEINRQSPFLVMHYVAGESLQERIDQGGPLELAELLRIGMQVASGLAAAHQQGLVHRDIKPSNILLEAAGVERALITDFGLALAADDVQITRSGAFMGTPQYMSPEQARGESVDYKSDLFSLGSVFYTLCTGRPAFRAASTLATMRRITDEQPTSIRQLNAEIPEWLSNIISKLMSKNKHERFSSAEQLADLLARCLAHVQQPESVPLPPEAARLSTTSLPATLSHRWTLAIAACLLVLFAVTVLAVARPDLRRPTSTGSSGIYAELVESKLSAGNDVLGHGYSRSGDKILYKDVPLVALDNDKVDFARTNEREFQLAEPVDAASFIALSETYTKDRNQVYFKLIKSGNDLFLKLPDADPRTFQVLSDKLATDLTHAWWQGNKLPNIDAKSLRMVHDGFVWKDSRNVWFQGYQIKDADPSSFEHLNQQYYRDTNRVYWNGSPMVDADPVTFRVLGNDLPYGADRDTVWHRANKLEGVDSSTFTAIHPRIYKDKSGVYADGRPIVNARPESFRLLAKLNDPLGVALMTDDNQYFVYLSPIAGVYQIESNGEFLILTQNISQNISRTESETPEKIEQVRVVLDSTGRNTHPVLEKYRGKVELMLSSHREHLAEIKSILGSRKKNLRFEQTGVPGNIVAMSSDQQMVILLNHPGVVRPIFGQPTLWDLEQTKQHSVLPESYGWNWSFVPNRALCLAVSAEEGRVRLWDYSEQKWFGDWISTVADEHLDPANNPMVSFGPNGSVMAVIGESAHPQFWNLTKSEPELIHTSEEQALVDHDETPNGTGSLWFSDDEKFCLMNANGQLTVWDAATGKKVAGPFEHSVDDFVYHSQTGQLATVHRSTTDKGSTRITIHAATDHWATVRTFDVPRQIKSAKWLGDKHLLTTMNSEANLAEAPYQSPTWAYILPTDADRPGDVQPIRETILTVAAPDGKRWIGINRHTVFCLSLGNPEPLWEKSLETWERQNPEEIQYQAWLNDLAWVAIEQRTKVGVLTVLDLNTGVEVLRTKGYVKAFVEGSSIAESYNVHRDNTRTWVNTAE
jgi:serine/threonine protein kinase